MGRGKHCSAEKRILILRLHKEGKTNKAIGTILCCSATMGLHIIHKTEKPEVRGRKLKIDARINREILQFVKKNPFSSSREIKNELNNDLNTSNIRRRLISNGLTAKMPKNHLITILSIRQKL